jgi:hypothetical protein
MLTSAHKVAGRHHPPRSSVRWLLCAMGTLTLSACAGLPPAPAPGTACAPLPADTPIIATLTGLFAAGQLDDYARFRSLTTTDFYAFDNGRRFDGVALMDLIKGAHAAGKQFQWAVTAPDVHVSCDWAWISYVNRGWVQDANGRLPMNWLESAVLRYDGGQWRVRFFHSTRAPAP